jgi:hypothetical protein
MVQESLIIVVMCRDLDLRFPSLDDEIRNDENWVEYYDVLHGRKID